MTSSAPTAGPQFSAGPIVRGVSAVERVAVRSGIEAAAALLDKKADDFYSEHGTTDPDTGTLEFGNGAGEDYYNSLRELADDIRAIAPAEPSNVRGRWNVEEDGDDLLVCFNDHEKGEKCEYVRYRRASATDADLTELREVAKLAWRALCDAEAVLNTIDGECTLESVDLAELQGRIGACAGNLFAVLGLPTSELPPRRAR